MLRSQEPETITATTAHCDTLFSCALEIFLLTYLLSFTYTANSEVSV